MLATSEILQELGSSDYSILGSIFQVPIARLGR